MAADIINAAKKVIYRNSQHRCNPVEHLYVRPAILALITRQRACSDPEGLGQLGLSPSFPPAGTPNSLTKRPQ